MTDAPLSLGGKAAVCAGGVTAVCGGLDTGGFKTGAALSVFDGGLLAGGGGGVRVRVDAAGPGGAGSDKLGASFGVDPGVVVATGAAAGVGADSLVDGDGGGLVADGAAGGGSSAAGTALTRSGRVRPPDDR